MWRPSTQIGSSVFGASQMAPTGGGNCTRERASVNRLCKKTWGNAGCGWSEIGRDAESPCEVMAAWPSLPPQIVQAIIALVRTARA